MTKEALRTVYHALSEKKGQDIRMIDISGVSTIADYFVVASGSNQNQLLAMQDAVEEALHKIGIDARQVEGNRASTWILLDFGDLIVHLFSEEDRLFYDLERIWKDGITMDTAPFEAEENA